MAKESINNLNGTDIKWWHKIFYSNVCKSIVECESEVRAYGALKEQVQNLKNDLDTCLTYLKNVYTYTRDGISCNEFDEGISKIDQYSKNIQKSVVTLEEVLTDINTEINKKLDEITSLKASIRL